MEKAGRRFRTFWKTAAIVLALLIAAAAPHEVKADPIQLTGGDTYRTAVTVKLGQDVDVHCDSDKSTQHFAFTTSSRADSTYTMHLEYLGGNISHDEVGMRIVSQEGTLIKYMDASSRNIGSRTITLKTNTRYYVLVYSSYWSGSSIGGLSSGETVDLSFRVSENIQSPANAQITKTKAAKKSITVYWSRSSAATRYRIRYRKSSSSKWKYKTTTKGSIKLSGLKRKTKYTIQVRGERVIGKKVYSGEWSDSVKIKTK